ncbi:MAG: septal ring lytic transglycosylase RlpA family protein [Gallionella sp.]|nr:septal ring lytic transglycosylase RlpA family protein [Gallionella sp.]MDD4945490.1 septal ring lytic transglycosylase RlpA family protein [Gallionella sp.]MDD5611944.1 septal ring lytic transglycosylase RlpA family protein [Gallionella sp.]
MNKQTVVLALAALLLTACGSEPQRQTEAQPARAPIEDHAATHPVDKPRPGSGGYLPGDGPGANAPANMEAIPDAVPVSEPLHRYANQPYVALGKTYTPLTVSGNFKERGIASWYGKKFHGQRTSSGEEYDMYAMTAAHPILPIPSYARVTNVTNGKSVVVRINDRGPFLHDRVIDLSYTAAYKLGIIGNGSQEVEVESVNPSAAPRTVAQQPKVESAPLEPAAPAAQAAAQPAAQPVVQAAGARGNVYLQLGAFSTRQSAERFMEQMRAKLGGLGRQLMLYQQDNKTRVHYGPYASETEARNSRQALHDRLGFMPVVNVHY